MRKFTTRWYLDNLISKYKTANPVNRRFADGRQSDEILKQLIDNQPLTKQKATEIIGNGSWTRIVCDECKKEVDFAMRMGEKPDYESATALLCLTCLRTAVQRLEEEVAKED